MLSAKRKTMDPYTTPPKNDYSHLKTYNYILTVQMRIRQAKDNAISFVFTILFRILFFITLSLLIFGLALFGFFVLHHLTLPTILHTFPVHLRHSDCKRDSSSPCNYPNATVPFFYGKAGKESPLLMPGQKYGIWMEVDLPESEVPQPNVQAGVFMISIDLRSYDGQVLRSSSRAALMQYRSYIHHVLRLVFLSPLYLLGYLEERQKLSVVLIESFQENPYSPVIDAVIEIRRSTIDIYNSQLFVEARLEGLRYWMHRYPIVIGSIIIAVNFLCGVILAGLSAYNRFARHGKVRDEKDVLKAGIGFDDDFDHMETSDVGFPSKEYSLTGNKLVGKKIA